MNATLACQTIWASTYQHPCPLAIFSCYYIAEHYRLAQKLPQALALYERCVDRAVVAKTKTQRLTSDSAGLNKVSSQPPFFWFLWGNTAAALVAAALISFLCAIQYSL